MAIRTGSELIVHTTLCKVMQPDRWMKCQDIYKDANANVIFKTYLGVEHSTNLATHQKLLEIVKSALTNQEYLTK